MRVTTAVEAKQEELGRPLTSGEVDFVRIQVERDEIVAQFPRVEDRSEEVKKTLQSLKDKVKKKQKTLWSADKLTLKKTPKTESDRKVEQRVKMSSEAKDIEKAKDGLGKIPMKREPRPERGMPLKTPRPRLKKEMPLKKPRIKI